MIAAYLIVGVYILMHNVITFSFDLCINICIAVIIVLISIYYLTIPHIDVIIYFKSRHLLNTRTVSVHLLKRDRQYGFELLIKIHITVIIIYYLTIAAY